MITEQIAFKPGDLVVFMDEYDFERNTYEITRILPGPLIQTDEALQPRYTPQEFMLKKPIRVGVMTRTPWFRRKKKLFFKHNEKSNEI